MTIDKSILHKMCGFSCCLCLRLWKDNIITSRQTPIYCKNTLCCVNEYMDIGCTTKSWLAPLLLINFSVHYIFQRISPNMLPNEKKKMRERERERQRRERERERAYNRPIEGERGGRIYSTQCGPYIRREIELNLYGKVRPNETNIKQKLQNERQTATVSLICKHSVSI